MHVVHTQMKSNAASSDIQQQCNWPHRRSTLRRSGRSRRTASPWPSFPMPRPPASACRRAILCFTQYMLQRDLLLGVAFSFAMMVYWNVCLCHVPGGPGGGQPAATGAHHPGAGLVRRQDGGIMAHSLLALHNQQLAAVACRAHWHAAECFECAITAATHAERQRTPRSCIVMRILLPS